MAITIDSFSATLDALLDANPHARNKGDVFKTWIEETFNTEARISHIREQRQTTNRVSEQFRYDNPIVVFVCDSLVKRDTLIQYVLDRSYRNLENVAIIGVSSIENEHGKKNVYTYEHLLVFRKSEFSLWAEPFFDNVENAIVMKKKLISTSDGSKYEGEIYPIIYYGAPGTGKTRYVQEEIFSKYDESNKIFTTFHQSYSYEDFVEGLKPILEDDSKDVKYHIESGVFYNACERAAILAGYDNLEDCIADTNSGRADKFYTAQVANKVVLLCIDEINRGNVASIFGDLISLIEPSKRLGAGTYEMIVTLPYSKKTFGVPANLFIVGTMNTADRSIQLLDSALRRRFKFKELLPDYSNFANINAKIILERINNKIRCLLNKDNQIGHTYLMFAKNDKDIFDVITTKIIPLLEEYFYDDIQKVRFVLNENEKTQHPFYVEDKAAKKAYDEYVANEDFDSEEKSFYILDKSIDETKCGEYLKHLLGENE